MPMHDWTRVEAGIYHHFHNAWLYQLAHALNNGVEPAGYYALQEQVVQPFEPDVIALQTQPDISPPGGGTALAAEPPKAAVVEAAPRVVRKKAHRRVSVRHVSGHRVIALIELVLPGNKSSARDFRAFVNKAADVIEERVSVVLSDPFPPTVRNPAGIHAAVWKVLTRKRYTPPPNKPLTAVACATGSDFLETVAA